MQALELFQSTFPRTICFRSPIPKPSYSPSASSLFPAILRSFSLSLSLPKGFLLPHCSSRSPNAKRQQGEQGGEQFEEEEHHEFGEEEGIESDGEDYSAVDLDALEEEARDAVREYSSTLSRELRIGKPKFSVFCV